MSTSAHARDINFVKVGAAAAFLLAATLVAGFATFGALTEAEIPRSETQEFLDDVMDDKNLLIAIVWLFAFSSLLMVPYFLGLYYGLRRWGEDYVRLAVLFGVVAAIFQALSLAPAAAVAAYIVPAWADASDEASRAIVLSDAKILLWTSDAMTAMFSVAIAIATIAASLVMLRIGRALWLVLGWIGIASGVMGIVAAFDLAEESLEIAFFISFILVIIWIVGVGVGLGWYLPTEEEQPETAAHH